MNSGDIAVFKVSSFFVAMDPAAQFLAHAKARSQRLIPEEVHPASVPGKTAPMSRGTKWHIDSDLYMIAYFACTHHILISKKSAWNQYWSINMGVLRAWNLTQQIKSSSTYSTFNGTCLHFFITTWWFATPKKRRPQVFINLFIMACFL